MRFRRHTDEGKATESQCSVQGESGLAAVRGDQTMAELASKYQVHPTQITQWKKQLLEALPEVFSHRRQRDQQAQDELTAQLYQQIGQLKVELDWLKKKSGFDP